MRIDSPAAFEELFEQYHAAIYRYCYRFCYDQDVARDLTSSTFERAWKARHSFSGEYPKAWLYRIAHNLLVDYLRKKKEVQVQDMSLYADSTSSKSVEDRELFIWQLGKALDRLPANYKSVIVLRFIDDLPVSDVASVLGLTEGNVRIIQFRALRRLREIYEEAK